MSVNDEKAAVEATSRLLVLGDQRIVTKHRVLFELHRYSRFSPPAKWGTPEAMLQRLTFAFRIPVRLTVNVGFGKCETMLKPH